MDISATEYTYVKPAPCPENEHEWEWGKCHKIGNTWRVVRKECVKCGALKNTGEVFDPCRITLEA
jgi:hypothetical protein